MSTKTPIDPPTAWPVRCPVCGEGKIQPIARSGRTARYKLFSRLLVPEDLEIPTCQTCGEEWIDRATAASIDAALEVEYRTRLRALVIADLEKLAAQNITQHHLEQVLGLSQGYLSKIRSGASLPSSMLVSCLHLLASDPDHRLREVEETFAAVAA